MLKKRKLNFLLSVLCFLILSGFLSGNENSSIFSYSKNDLSGNEVISLVGLWNFKASNTLKDIEVLNSDYSTWDTLYVPGNWDSRSRYSHYSGKGYYQRIVEIPERWKGKQIFLAFDAVYHDAKIWLDGQLIGTHIGGYTPFELNITPFVEVGKSYSLVVMADNSYRRGAWWPWGGISRKVSLIAQNPVRIVYQHIDAIPDFIKKEVKFQIKYRLENHNSAEYHGSLSAFVKSKNKILHCEEISISLKGNQVSDFVISFVGNLADFKLWSIEEPNLYFLESVLSENMNIVFKKVDRFGIRKIEIRGEQMFLNNMPIRANGVNRIHDHPNTGNTEPDWLVKADMLDIKSLGCNFARLMHAPLSENLLDFCDSIGFLIIEEIPVWGDDDPQAFKNNPLTKQWLREMVYRDYNHPCVIGWSVGNELRDPIKPWGEKTLTKEQFEYVNSMLDYLDSIDSNRLKTYVSITAYQGPANRSNEPFDKIDFISINSYGNAISAIERTHKKFSGKPIFISEIGLKQIGTGTDAQLSPQLIESISKIKEQFPFVIGVSLWCYNDYRSDYKNTPPSGYREWGIVDQFRNKKKAYFQLKELYMDW